MSTLKEKVSNIPAMDEKFLNLLQEGMCMFMLMERKLERGTRDFGVLRERMI